MAKAESPKSSGVTQVMERVLRRLLEHPYAFPMTALGLSLVTSLARRWDAPDRVLELVMWSAAMAGWLPLWVGRGKRDPGGRTALTIVIALVGSLLQGRLVALEMGFAILALTLMPQYFIRLPFPVAVISILPPAIGSEYSHRLEVLANPDGFPWGIALLRGLALLAIGVTFKVMAIQIEERKRLQKSLASAERKAGMLEERQRLAREIHDTLAQGFASILLHFERAEQVDERSESPARPHLALARSVAREGLEEARRMLAALRPEVLEQRALPEAVGRVCEDWSHRFGLAANLSITGTPGPLHPDIELAVLRAVQEALTNVARHSGAKTAAVTLSYMEDLIVLDVQDDGRGLPPGSETGRGYGLTGMRERAERVGGSLSVESAPGEGTTISITLPAVLSSTGEVTFEGVRA
ncbi:MAG TPA: sensor histidine kinase [Gemmatimonadales bacterium]|nr:sensor histidine kinase [Gemmatimonadales bacterium]